VIGEALAGACGTIGFRSEAVIDTSSQTVAMTRFAVARAKQGDRDALNFLYVSYSNNIYGYVRSIVRDEHEAEDVTQHVFAKLMTSVVKYDDRGGPFPAWLLRLARNVAVDHLRANRLTPTETVINPDAASRADSDRTDSVRVALASLPSQQREVVLLRHLVGLTPTEIAARMGRSKSSVHSLHHRGRRTLQRELEQLGSAPFTRSTRESVAA
jgi:RNA polymerase sigma-70 factor, ECF subfamily